MLFAVTDEKKAMEKLAPVISDKWALFTRGEAILATLWVQFRDSIRLPIINPRETKKTNLRRGQPNPCHSINNNSGSSMLIHYNRFDLSECFRKAISLYFG
jgi:hypothetical protein